MRPHCKPSPFAGARAGDGLREGWWGGLRAMWEWVVELVRSIGLAFLSVYFARLVRVRPPLCSGWPGARMQSVPSVTGGRSPAEPTENEEEFMPERRQSRVKMAAAGERRTIS